MFDCWFVRCIMSNEEILAYMHASCQHPSGTRCAIHATKSWNQPIHMYQSKKFIPSLGLKTMYTRHFTCCCGCFRLKQWGQDKMPAMLQMTFSNSFSCIKIFFFIQVSLKFVDKGPLDNFGLGYGLAPKRWQTIIWTDGDLVYWCLNA